MLSIGAFNALLKTLEEPPSYVIFILATTEAHKIPVTILSRCQRYDFRRIGQETIQSRLEELLAKEQIEAEEKALRYIAKKGDGSLRDSLSLLDQCIAFYLGEKLTYDKVLEVLGAVDTEVFSDLLRKILKEDLVDVIRTLETLIMQGRDLTQFVSDFTWYLRNLMLLKSSDDMEDVLDVSSENLIQLREEAAMIRTDTLMRFIRIFSDLSNAIRYASNRRVLIEMALIKLCRPEAERDEISLVERIRRLEKKMEEGYAVRAGSDGSVRPEVSGVSLSRGSAAAYSAGAVGGSDAYSTQSAGSLEAYGVSESAESIESRASYAKAAPEDLQKVRAMWKNIVNDTSGMFRVVLSSAVPKFNTQDEKDCRLFVVFADFLGERYLNNAARKEELEQIIEDRIGRHVEIKFTLAADEGIQNTRLSVIEIEERIHEFIHTDIEIEEES